MERFSEDCQNALKEAGVVDVEQIMGFTPQELKELFAFKPSDQVVLKGMLPRRRAREEDDENQGNGEGESVMLVVDVCIRELLPSCWTTLDPLSLRSAVYGAAKTPINIHVTQELDFIISLVPLAECFASGGPGKGIIWTRLMMLILKTHFPQATQDITRIWNAVAAKKRKGTEEEMLRIYASVKAELQKIVPPSPPPFPFRKPPPPPFRKPPGRPGFSGSQK